MNENWNRCDGLTHGSIIQVIETTEFVQAQVYTTKLVGKVG